MNRIIVVWYTFYGCCTYMDHATGCLTVTILKTSIPSFSSFPSSPISRRAILNGKQVTVVLLLNPIPPYVCMLKILVGASKKGRSCKFILLNLAISENRKNHKAFFVTLLQILKFTTFMLYIDL